MPSPHAHSPVPDAERGVSRVYLEPDVILLAGAGGAGLSADDAGRAITPEASESLVHLAEAGHELVLLSGAGVSPDLGGLAIEVGVEDALPEHPPPGTWLLTSDPDVCASRPSGFRTILIGPRRAPGPRPTAHCDLEARDLPAAVLEILTREAMD